LGDEQLAGRPPSATEINSDIPALCRGPHLVSVRHLPAADAATLFDGFGLTTPAAAPVVAQSAAVDAYALTTGRVVGTVAALVALAGVVVGGLALARSARRISNGGRRGAIVALVAGPTGMVIGGLWWPPPRVVPAPATGSSAALRVSPET
jgi:hypothetical protein